MRVSAGWLSLLVLPLMGAQCPKPEPKTDGGVAEEVLLEPPPSGQGFQLTTPAFDVAAGQEVQDCYFFQIPGEPGSNVNIHKLEVAQNDGSHHMNVFRVRTVQRNPDGSARLGPENGAVSQGLNGMGECFRSSNWADWPLIINSQSGGTVDWTLPDGVVQRFTPGEWVMLQTHYVNATTQATSTRGKVYVNFWAVPDSAVVHEMGTLFATKQSIRVCQANPNPSFDGTCQFNSATPLRVIGANGHFHSRGRNFTMYGWDGTSTMPAPADQFYVSDTWDDPPMMRSPQLDKEIPANGGIFYTCGFEWQPPPSSVGCEFLNNRDRGPPHNTPEEDLDCCYTFGGLVESSEHCNIFVYYYPKVDDVNCF
jgi:hypothetical protein